VVNRVDPSGLLDCIYGHEEGCQGGVTYDVPISGSGGIRIIPGDGAYLDVGNYPGGVFYGTEYKDIVVAPVPLSPGVVESLPASGFTNFGLVQTETTLGQHGFVVGYNSPDALQAFVGQFGNAVIIQQNVPTLGEFQVIDPFADGSEVAPAPITQPLLLGQVLEQQFPGVYPSLNPQQVNNPCPDKTAEATAEPTQQRVLFGQKRISANFDERGYFGKYTIYGLAYQLGAGGVSAADVPVEVFERQGVLIAINNRSLAALSLANLRPVNIIRVTPSFAELARLTEPPLVVPPSYNVPGNIIQPPSEYTAVTPSIEDLYVEHVIRIAI